MTSSDQAYRERIGRVVAAIVAEPDADYSLAELAALAHFSPFHFHRIYRSLMGETVADTVRRLRLARAAARLGADEGSVTGIGQDAGYDSPQAFSRAFRQFTGDSPRAFQRRLRELGQPEESMEVTLAEHPPLHLLVLPHRGPYGMIPHTHRAMYRLLAGQAVRQWYGLSYGDPELDGEPNYFVGAALDAEIAAPPDCSWRTVAGGYCATHRLTGPYTQIGPTIAALYTQWLPSSGYEPDDRPLLEVYFDPEPGQGPEHYRTDLLVPVRLTGGN